MVNPVVPALTPPPQKKSLSDIRTSYKFFLTLPRLGRGPTWDLFGFNIYYITTSALDNSATAPPGRLISLFGARALGKKYYVANGCWTTI